MPEDNKDAEQDGGELRPALEGEYRQEQGQHEEVAREENSLPPEAQGETNGGPLGCCLGVMVGLLLSSSVIIVSYVYAIPLRQALGDWLNPLLRISMVILAIVAVIVCGRFGWKIGKILYREYEVDQTPRQRRSRRKKL